MSTKEIYSIFSKNLTYWLHKRGKTQADLAKRIGVSTATTSNWCNNTKIPRTDKIIEIANWLMIDLSDLLQEKEHMAKPLDDVIFKLKDDTTFKNLVVSISELDNCSYEKVIDYVNLLKK